jgi:transcriptional regulator with XRE-family HTH domain
MEDPRKTGAFISHLRKARNWTQLELADRLSVTHQAVSRWETGMSFPDIGTLVRVAELFGVQVDDVLSGEVTPRANGARDATLGQVLTELAHDNPQQVAHMVHDGRVPIDTVIAAGPLTPPTTMERLMSALNDVPFTNRQIRQLAPFLSQDMIEHLLYQDGGGAPQLEMVKALAPFLEAGMLEQLVQQTIEGALDLEYLCHIAPFLSRELRDTLLTSSQNDARFAQVISCLAPFLDAEQRDAIVARVVAGSLDLSIGVSLAPFLSQPALLSLLTAPGAGEYELLGHLAPFLSQETIGQLLTAFTAGRSTTRLEQP